MTENEISKIVFDCAIKIHRALGPGLFESAYEACMFHELKKTGVLVEKQKAIPLIYEDVKLEVGYSVNIITETKVILEIKSVDTLNDVPIAQVLTYLKLSVLN